MKSIKEIAGVARRPAPTLSDLPREIGERLRRQRIAFNWRQTDFAEHAGVSAQTIKALEKGEPVSYESLFRVLLALGHGTDFLRMLEFPHFPNLKAQERFFALSQEGLPSDTRVRSREAP